ncbi:MULTISPECIES: hypothetical protein [unclassified Campylobacter]|uniref:hypothetical protein n=1 Tax=unclassified Campylobacter TaxID=2593542 RepID=UPI00163CBE64|nr:MULTISPECIES: hypothetical protein [unclassified Campylobacter]
MRLILFVLPALLLIFSACANHAADNQFYEKALSDHFCSESFFKAEQKRMDSNKDIIYTGLNAGAIARNCQDFNTSNDFLDKAEEAYKYDVDLEGLGSKGARLVGSALVNEAVFDYQGTLYERIMVNVYKGLNFMSLNDFENARVEFNRALMRQDKAKEYFASQIAASRAEFEEAKKTQNFDENMQQNYENVLSQYDHLLKDFDTSKNFINPYATYTAALFFFLDKDYTRAVDLLKEVAVINSRSAEFKKEFRVFNQYASSTNPQRLQKYIFVVYESGFGAGLDELSFTLPFIFDDNLITSSFALPTLKKRENSFSYLLANETKTSQFVSFDDVIATEFKTELASKITKAISSTILKTTLNAAVAKNDPTGGLLSMASSIVTASTSRADVRFWNALPKFASVAMIENNGELVIKSDDGRILYTNNEINKDKNAMLVIRSYLRYLPNAFYLIQP